MLGTLRFRLTAVFLGVVLVFALVSIALVAWLVFGRFLKADSEAALETPSEGITRSEVVRSVSGDHLER